MYFAIFTRDDENSKQIERACYEQLINNNFIENKEKPDYVICVGGDGTFLRAVQHYFSNISQITFVGIKSGTLGYFCAYESNEIELLVSDLINKSLKIETYPLLKGIIYDHERVVDRIYAVNEIRIENPFKTMICEVLIDEEKLEEFRGNGILVSSTLGSTAYNKSCGGAIIDSKLDLLELTEIAPIENIVYHSLKESLVLSSHRKITIKSPFKEEVVGYDHKLYKLQERITHVTISYSNKKIKLAIKPFIRGLRQSFIIDK